MNVKKTYLRFNVDKEADRKAWEYIQSLDKRTHKSVNRFVISLINTYAQQSEKAQAETELAEKIVSAVREELKAFAPLQLFQLLGQMQQSMPKEQNSAENENQALDFLNVFGGGE